MTVYNKEYHKAYREKHKALVAERKRKCYQARKEEIKARTRKYAIENRIAQNISKKKYNDKRAKDPGFRLCRAIGHQLYLALRESKAGRKWETLVGYSLHDLKNHLKSLFEDGMSWNNYGDWHIDHKRPVCSFDLNIETEIKECWKLENLRPLWKTQNLSKASQDKLLRISIK